ncbi:hypothetical protein QBC35DRAFT_491092 [Podospora australis]|uniref:Secreted protein n=1 Tax=Podospora australis TaxID=1536484 RepID=A0AAN6WZ05_9PEZI|nr:hypothetical protein QBC35DRAFT_491092 [Podospora australis]
MCWFWTHISVVITTHISYFLIAAGTNGNQSITTSSPETPWYIPKPQPFHQRDSLGEIRAAQRKWYGICGTYLICSSENTISVCVNSTSTHWKAESRFAVISMDSFQYLICCAIPPPRSSLTWSGLWVVRASRLRQQLLGKNMGSQNGKTSPPHVLCDLFPIRVWMSQPVGTLGVLCFVIKHNSMQCQVTTLFLGHFRQMVVSRQSEFRATWKNRHPVCFSVFNGAAGRILRSVFSG